MPIKILSPEVATLIAAGEVVERPASVVKELVENSIDASASSITVEIEGGGTGKIRVIDDGVGIPAEEVSVAFQRHATSKLYSQEQLDSIATLGFRGEALPSIAAVARSIVITTRLPLSIAGFRLELRFGEVVEAGSHGCPPGTALEVRDLFGNLPVRKKFLRSTSAETSRIQEVVSRYALAFPAIRFQLINQGRTSFATPGNGQPRDTLLAVYGQEAARNMLEVHGVNSETGYQVDGFVSFPGLSRANRTYMTFFVNRRWVQSRMLSFALEEAYLGLLQVKRYPLAALNVSLPYGEVDVNSHPAKREVRFHDERGIFSAVQRAVRAALVADSPVQSLSSPGNLEPATPLNGRPSFFSRGPFPGERESGFAPGGVAFGSAGSGLVPQPGPPMKVVGQLKMTYIVGEGQGGMYLVDQHAAHERILFDSMNERSQERTTEYQALLEPINVELSPSQAEILANNTESLSEYGFRFEPFGDGSYLLRAVPVVLAAENPGRSLMDILDIAAFEGMVRQKEDLIAASIACHGAIRAGKSLTNLEMSSLLEKLESTPNPHTCPHGRPTMVHFSTYHMEREFGRR